MQNSLEVIIQHPVLTLNVDLAIEHILVELVIEQLIFYAETAEPEVKVLNLTILSPGRPDLVLPIPFQADEKGYAFALKDGSSYSFRFSFNVSNNIVSGLKYTNTVWKTGVKGVDTTNSLVHI